MITIYQSNNNANRLSESYTRAQENGRFALDFLARDLRLAGFPKTNATVRLNGLSVSGNNTNPVIGDDVLVIQHQGASTADCLGTAVGPAVTIANTYSTVDTGRTNAAGNPIFALNCNNAELVEGIENMQVLYGIDPDEDGSANQYLTAATVTDWTTVVSVRIAILASSVNPGAQVSSERTFTLLNENPLGPFVGDRIISLFKQ